MIFGNSESAAPRRGAALRPLGLKPGNSGGDLGYFGPPVERTRTSMQLRTHRLQALGRPMTKGKTTRKRHERKFRDSCAGRLLEKQIEYGTIQPGIILGAVGIIFRECDVVRGV